MRALPVDLENVAYIAHNMREWDRHEILATRWDDDLDGLINDCLAWRGFTWAVGLDEPIALIGAAPLHPCVWQVHMFATDRFTDVGIGLTRFALRVIIPALKAAGAHRLECRSIEGHIVAHRWLEFLGGVHEADLPMYGRKGETFRLYAWHKGLDNVHCQSAEG